MKKLTINKNDKVEKLKALKKRVEASHDYFSKNYKRYNEFMKFAFVSNQSQRERNVNIALKRPNIEFNAVEAYISSKRGEFAENVPEFKVSSSDGREASADMIKVIEGHVRYILSRANKNLFEYNIYSETCGGGFSVAKVLHDYEHEMSFDQEIKLEKAFSPLLCGFDPTASLKDKSDGDYCFEVFPMRKEEFEREFGKGKTESMSFSQVQNGEIAGFSWSFSNQKSEDVVIVCDFYEKKKTRKKIVKLATGEIMTMSDYNKMLENWNQIGQKPIIEGKPRVTEITKIMHYRLVETEVLSEQETIYSRLPLVFIDGNSVTVSETSTQGSSEQVTRPMIYQAKGAQRLKNAAGQTLVNELERIVQAIWLVPKGGIPEGHDVSYSQIQDQKSLQYNQYLNDDPNVPLNPPRLAERQPIPGEVMGAFGMADQVMNAALGSFDATLARANEGNTSGRAIEKTVELGYGPAKPYMVSYLSGLESLATLILELIPKIYVTPRSIPVIAPDGSKEFIMINQVGQPSVQYSPNSLMVEVSAGPNFRQQQQKALADMVSVSQVNEVVKSVLSGSKGVQVLLDNMDFRGKEQLKEVAEQVGALYEQQQQLAMQAQQMELQKQKRQAEFQAQQPDAVLAAAQAENQKTMIKAQQDQAKLAHQMNQDAREYNIKLAKLEMERDRLKAELAKIAANIENETRKTDAEVVKTNSEVASTAADIALKAAESVPAVEVGVVEVEQSEIPQEDL